MLTEQIDTSYSVATPEGITLRLTPVGPVPRLYAWLVDTLIRIILYLFLAVISKALGNFGIGIVSIIIFLIEWFYPVFFEILYHGQTPGKKIFGIYVAHENGVPVTSSASLVRNIIRFIDFLPLFYGFAFVTMLLNQKFQRLGDLAANTVVLYLPPKSQKLHENKEPETITAIPPPVSFTLKEQQAIISFSARTRFLNKERTKELAQQLTEGLITGQQDPVQYVNSIANGLMGKLPQQPADKIKP